MLNICVNYANQVCY